MKFAVIQCVNGNFTVVSEHGENYQAAIVKFHDVCKNLWNAKDVERATVMIVDSNLNCYAGYKESIGHDQAE